jgi:hypothetical protein
LHLGFDGARTGGEYVEDEFRAIQDTNAYVVFDGFALRRREFVIEDYKIRFGARHGLPKLLQLAFPYVKARMGSVDPLPNHVDDLTAGGVGQPGQLLQMLLSNPLVEGLQWSSDEYGPIHAHAIVDQLGRNIAPMLPGTSVWV